MLPQDARVAMQAEPQRQLGVFDSVCIIIGIVIGSGVYESTPIVADNVGNAAWLLAVWVLGGIISLLGAVCFAELATALPHEGGDYVFLKRAYGESVGFLFAWAQLWIIRPGSIGAIAFVFGKYATNLVDLGTYSIVIHSSGCIVILSLINILGVHESKWTQNALSVLKVAALVFVVVVGLASSFGRELSHGAEGEATVAKGEAAAFQASEQTGGPRKTASAGLALIFVMFTYGGWHEMAFVGAELRDPRRNILRSLLLGTASLVLIYCLTNIGFLSALGFEGLGHSTHVAVDILRGGLGTMGGKIIAAIVCITALGSVNGMIFTGSRVYYASGVDHRMFGLLGKWHYQLGTPVRAILIQSGITLALTVGFGLEQGQAGFGRMVVFSTPIYWLFFLAVCVSLPVLRWREPDLERPYMVPFYPWVPMVFSLSSLYLVYASVDFAWRNLSSEILWSLLLFAAGCVACLVERCWLQSPGAHGT